MKPNVDLTQNLMFSSHSPADDFISELLYVNKPWEFESVLILAHDSTLLQKNRIPWNSIKSNITFKYCNTFFWNFRFKNFSKNSREFPWNFGFKNISQNFHRFPWNF